jgi:hypothetical protein
MQRIVEGKAERTQPARIEAGLGRAAAPNVSLLRLSVPARLLIVAAAAAALWLAVLWALS